MLVGISVAFIVISLLALTRSIRQSILIMLPAATGIGVMLAVLVLLGQGMSVVTVVAAILVLGLEAIMGFSRRMRGTTMKVVLGQGMSSVLLSFLTTLAGTGAMLLARSGAVAGGSEPDVGARGGVSDGVYYDSGD